MICMPETPCSAFQSTPSAWRVTIGVVLGEEEYRISIHTLRMEGDNIARALSMEPEHFNPHPPHGG